MTPELKQELQALGYIVLQMDPTKWRIRGEADEDDWRSPGKWIDVWPIHGFYRLYWESGKAKPYTDIVATVQSKLKPWATLEMEQQYAYDKWQDGLARIHEFLLA